MPLALSTCIMFISLMQSVNGTDYSNITFLLPLFATVAVAVVFETDIVPLTSMHAWLQAYKLDFNIVVSNLSIGDISYKHKFISTQFIVLIWMDDLLYSVKIYYFWYSIIILLP